MFRRPHSVFESPYDPQKDVWIVDDYRHAIFRFSNDGKKLLQTIGTPNVPGTDSTHFYRPTFMAWAPNGDFYVADGYQNTRVVKFDRTGKFLMAWGERGENGKETRLGYFNNVHGVAVDPQTGRVFVNDRGNRRIQVFDANGKPLDSWSVGTPPADIHLIYMDGSRMLWAFDRASSKMIKYDLSGNLHVHVGHVGQRRRILGRARHARRLRRQFLRGRGRQRRRAEVPSASRRKPGVSVDQTGRSCHGDPVVLRERLGLRNPKALPTEPGDDRQIVAGLLRFWQQPIRLL